MHLYPLDLELTTLLRACDLFPTAVTKARKSCLGNSLVFWYGFLKRLGGWRNSEFSDENTKKWITNATRVYSTRWDVGFNARRKSRMNVLAGTMRKHSLSACSTGACRPSKKANTFRHSILSSLCLLTVDESNMALLDFLKLFLGQYTQDTLLSFHSTLSKPPKHLLARPCYGVYSASISSQQLVANQKGVSLVAAHGSMS